ncbi:hypothetical protein KR009_006900, partial [Drosophila setifemur]
FWQLEELDSERLNELESILYASIHYSDGTDEQASVEPAVETPSDQDARSMPPPPQQDPSTPGQRHVSGTRVINNAKPKPRYWAEAVVAEGQVVKQQQAPNKTNQAPEMPSTSSPKLAEKQNDNRPPLTPQNAAPSPTKAANQQPRQQQKQQQKQQNNQPQKPKQQLQANQQQKEKPSPKQSPVVQKPQATSTTITVTPTKANYEAYEKEPFDQRLLVAIPPNCSPRKQPRQQGKQQQQQNKQQQQQHEPGPFGKANRKLEQMQKLAAKKQKSKLAQVNKKQRKQQSVPVEFVDLDESTNTSDDDDEVIHVPLPPVPIIDLDTSDGEQESGSPQVYHEENAMDATDVKLSLSLVADAVGQDTGAVTMLIPQSLQSPCSSVLSSDDFIVQQDTSRLQADREKADDEDLLVLTENAIREALDVDNQEGEGQGEKAPADSVQETDPAADTSSEYEFVPPSRLEEIKKNYRVDDQQFRALDVYESESDLTESGIYSKAKSKAPPTIIRSVDSPSGSSSVEEVQDSCVQKTKRLRKRSYSINNHSQSEGNNENEMDDSESDDGVHSTGVPGIARGMAVERCKRKIRRISTRRSSEDTQKKGARNQKPKPSASQEASSESASEDELPSAREIAERLLRQEQEQTKEQPVLSQPSTTGEALDTISIGSDANSQGEAEFHEAMTDRIAAVFERIDAQRKMSQDKDEEEASGYLSSNEEDSMEKSADTTMRSEEEAALEVIQELKEEDPEENDLDMPMEDSPIQVEHNVAQLMDESLPSGGQLIGWNDEMCRFYNDSWHGEQFSVHKIQRAMSAHRQEWRINNADRYPVVRPRSHAKCTNCFEMGHVRSKCPRPKKPLVCYICGAVGHAEPRCPNAICFGCGSKQAIYVQQCNKCTFHSRLVCQLCKMRGHGMDTCPDKWRRYHSTTRSNVELNSNVQYKNKQCSYCAGRGHLFENCRQRIGEYRGTNYTSQIVSHQKIYKDRSGPLGYLGDLSSFFVIDTPFHFEWIRPNMPKTSYYAKFLINVNLARTQPIKRKSTTALAEIPAKIYTNDYAPNPLVKAARGQAKDLPDKPREKPVVEKSSGIIEPAVQEEPQTDPIQREEISTNFQIRQTEVNKAKHFAAPHDSDSNYSFSEHFEVPSSTTTEDREAEPAETLPPHHPLFNLPDVIPLGMNSDVDFEIPSNSQGISMCVNAGSGNKRNETNQLESGEELPDLPSEGKIIMARDQSEYLFSPEGRQFLATAAKECQVSVRMDFKDYGYVLVIYGLKQHQEDLQVKLLRRHQDVKRKSVEFQSQKPPKRIDVLIRFMRDGLNSLSSNLGSAKNHFQRIKELEDMNTKNGFKMAEKKRRQLNMILVGQAGLLNGNTHLDQLLVLLRRLLDNFSPDENATSELRNEIEEHWRMIFTAYPHPNYDSLLQSYGRLDQKNRVPSLHIDPVLLGLQQAPKKQQQPQPQSPGKRAKSLSPPPPPAWPHMAPPPPPIITKKKQRQALQQQQSKSPQQNQHQQQRQKNQHQNQMQRLQQQQQLQQQQLKNQHQQQRLQQLPLHQRLQEQQEEQHQQQQYQQQQNNHQQFRRPQSNQMPFNNMQQRSRADLQLRHSLDPECDRLLTEMGHTERGSINKDANKPSMFWSRESLKYLDDLFKMTSNPDTEARLNRVLQRSQRGQLSHNDYRAVIRLHSLLSN